MADGPVTDKTTLKRLPERGSHERAVAYGILDEALICHVGFVTDDGYPVVIPTIHARLGDTLYIHGSVASRMLRTIKKGGQISVNVALVDGVVLARSHFHSSMNYRSVVIFGQAHEVTDPAELAVGFEAVVEHMAQGRWSDGRIPTDKETKATTLVAMPIEEFSAKVRTGGPGDDPEDLEGPYWGGVVPLRLVADHPIDAEDLAPGIDPPEYVLRYERP